MIKKFYALVHPDKEEFGEAKEKIVDLARLMDIVKKNKFHVVFTKGVFDIVHGGHIRLFDYCRKIKEKENNAILVIGVYSDAAVRKNKGPNRPINTQDERAELIASLNYIDYVVLFNGKYPVELIKELKPSYYIKGQDTAKISAGLEKNMVEISPDENNPEIKILNEYGGKLVIFSDNGSISTTETIKKVIANEIGNKTNSSVVQKAMNFAFEAHKEQRRHGGKIPYFVHCMDVAAILAKNGASDDMVAAGFLHDIIEDSRYTHVTEKDIRKEFGGKITELILPLTEDENLMWEERKKRTIKLLKKSSKEVQLLKCADNIANLRDINFELARIGNPVWDFFEAKKEKKKEVYLQLLDSFNKIKKEPIYLECAELISLVFR